MKQHPRQAVPIEPFQLFVGAALGFAGSGAMRWWQYRRDAWIGRVETFCSALALAADTASEQWLYDRSVEDVATGDAKFKAKRLLLEAKTLGLQIRLDGMYASFCDRLSQADRKLIQSSMNELSKAMTGGDFGVGTREADPYSARLAQTSASELIVLVRVAVDHAFSMQGLRTYLFERAADKQSRAINGSQSS